MDDLIIFMDGRCPECGRFCWNGGSGPLRCKCGWVGAEPSESLMAAIDRMFDEEFEEEVP